MADVAQSSPPSPSPTTDNGAESREEPGPPGPGIGIAPNRLCACKYCPEAFNHRRELSLHLSSTHGNRTLYRCPQCPLVFAAKREFSTHARIHSGESPHECQQCGKLFRTKQLLKKHESWHTGERPHVCQYCNKAFNQKGHLTQHYQIHAGDRPHKCTICSKSFIFKFDLNRHMLIHGDRNFSCKRCHRSFAKQRTLDDHIIKNRCRGIDRTSSSGSPPPSTPTSPASARQSVVQQQRPLPVSLTPPTARSPPLVAASGSYNCMVCGQSHASTADLAVHLALAHFNTDGGGQQLQQQQMTSSSGVKQESPPGSPLSSSLAPPTRRGANPSSALRPVKREHSGDTATESSGASSPSSRAGSTFSFAMEERGGAAVTPSPSASLCHSKCRSPECAARELQHAAEVWDLRRQLEVANGLLTLRLHNDQQPVQQLPPQMPDLMASLNPRGGSPPAFPFSLQSILANTYSQ